MSVPETLKFLENHLAQYSYIEGYQPSTADVFMHNFLKTHITSKYPNIYRWFKHIESFNIEEMKCFITTMLNPALTSVINGDGDAQTSAAAADDDDVDLFASDEEDDAEAERIKEERLKAYAEKKSKKAPVTAKSSIVLDVKPWDDETNMKGMEEVVRSVEMDGLVWGASKLVPLAYGIKKLQICCVVEDEKVSVDELTERIQEFEDFVQSVDIAAFNKI